MKLTPFRDPIKVGARGSLLSKVQVKEIERALNFYYPEVSFQPIWIETLGDQDKTTPLKEIKQADFFTRQIDELQLKGAFRIAIHSAKDLASPLPNRLKLVALTRGLTASDAIVHNCKEFPSYPKIGTSSFRREQEIRKWNSKAICVDLRGTIEERLLQLDKGYFDGIVVAECALIRLGLTDRKRILLPNITDNLQGKLAVIAREEDIEMQHLFEILNENRG